MKEWEQFENEATKFLNSRFGSYARFFQKGGSDSTIPDIRVETHTGKTFYIEAKHSPAQCGQFVLLPDIESGHFRYSEKNVNRIKNIFVCYCKESLCMIKLKCKKIAKARRNLL